MLLKHNFRRKAVDQASNSARCDAEMPRCRDAGSNGNRTEPAMAFSGESRYAPATLDEPQGRKHLLHP